MVTKKTTKKMAIHRVFVHSCLVIVASLSKGMRRFLSPLL